MRVRNLPISLILGRLLLALLVLGVGVPRLAAQSTAALGDIRIAVADDQAAMLVEPGAVVTFRAQATDSSGAGAGGEEVVFSTDFRRPAGSFGGGIFQSVIAGADGSAEAAFTVGDEPGLFFIEVQAGGEASATIALTVGTTVGETALSAAEARALTASQTLSNPSNGIDAVLHGPVLLPAGTRIDLAGPKLGWEFESPVSTTESTWLLWVDDEPLAGFSHAVRWVMLPAADSGVGRMRLLNQLWWPVALLPGSLTRYSLGPRADDPGGVASIPAALSAEGVLGGAPPNACAVLVYGPRMLGPRNDMSRVSDYLVNSDMVPTGNVFRNRLDARGRPSAQGQEHSSTRADLQRLISAAVAAGCIKLHLVIVAHGAPNGGQQDGGFQLAVNDNTDTGFVTYEELAVMLAPFQGRELCVISTSCYSGQLALWLQGLGFSGQVMTSSDTRHVGWMNAQGAKLLTAILPILQGSEGDLDGDGVISYQEAIARLYAINNDTHVVDSGPVGIPISPTGPRQAVAPDLFLWGAGSRRTFFFPRPKTMPQGNPYTIKLNVQDDSIADFGVFENIGVPVPAFAPGAQMTLIGKKCDETTYNLILTDLVTGQEYVGEAAVEVNQFKFDKAEIVLQMGSTGNPLGGAMLMRFGNWFRNAKDNSNTYTIRSTNPAIARPGRDEIDSQHGQQNVSIVAEGLMPGRTFFVVTDKFGWSKLIPVIVLPPPPPPAPSAAPCPATNGQPISYQGQATVALPVKSDPGGHRPFVNAPATATMNVRIENGLIVFSGGPTQLVPAEGPFDPTTCTGSATGISTRPIAGFNNVQGRYLNIQLSFPGGPGKANLLEESRPSGEAVEEPAITFDYELGGRGEFPGGMPIIYAGAGVLPTPEGGCSYLLQPSRTGFPSTGGEGQAGVVPAPSCVWALEEDADWLTFETVEGEGPTLVSFTVAPNPDAVSRTATVRVGEATFNVMQSAAAGDPPRIADFGVVNGATFQSGLTSGGWFTVAGANYSPVTRSWGDGDFPGGALPTGLDGVQVRVNGKPGFMSFVSGAQLNVLADEDPVIGDVMVEVETPEGVSETFFAKKLPFDPEFFRFAPEQGRYVAAVHADGTIVGKDGLFASITTRPARPGDILQVFGTGFGPTSPPTPIDRLVTQARPLEFTATVRIGGRDVVTLFQGVVGAGLVQLNVVAPDLPPGDYRIEALIEGYELAAPAFLTIAE